MLGVERFFFCAGFRREQLVRFLLEMPCDMDSNLTDGPVEGRLTLHVLISDPSSDVVASNVLLVVTQWRTELRPRHRQSLLN